MSGGNRFARSLAASAAASALGILVASGGGCELLVSDSVPSFTCVPGVGNACPEGSVCVPATQTCVLAAGTCTAESCHAGYVCDATLKCVPAQAGDASSSGGDDAHAPSDAAASLPDTGSIASGDAASDPRATLDASGARAVDSGDDAGVDAGGPCRGVTCKCSSPTDCDGGICADTLTVTQALYEANMSTSFCTQSCCSSADCPGSTVCFGTGAGGSYCVAPGWIGRSKAGTAEGGAACKASTDCRSGLCASGACADTCCSTAQESAECATGTVCRFAAFPGNGFDTHETPWCGAPVGTTAGGMPCANDGACQSGKCAGFTLCEAVCRSTPDCTQGQACVYGLGPGPLNSTKDIVAGCLAITGSGVEGANCAMNADCMSDFCDGTHCTDVCFSDADCKADWHCRPEMVSVQSGGSYSVLCCQG